MLNESQGHSLWRNAIYQYINSVDAPLFYSGLVGLSIQPALSLELVVMGGFFSSVTRQAPAGLDCAGKGGHLSMAWTCQLCPQHHGEFACRV